MRRMEKILKAGSLFGRLANCRPKDGFSIIELIIVITIFSITAASTLPLLTMYKEKQTLSGLTTEMVQVLRRAQGRSLSGTNGLPWGIFIARDDDAEDAYTMFAGDEPNTPENARLSEVHEIRKPFRLCTNSEDQTIRFPIDPRIALNESYFIEIYSSPAAEDKSFVLIDTTGSIEAVRTHPTGQTCQ